ncbi:MAG: hypothetical protein V4529_17385 [Gemmatimonadota bacterium]
MLAAIVLAAALFAQPAPTPTPEPAYAGYRCQIFVDRSYICGRADPTGIDRTRAFVTGCIPNADGVYDACSPPPDEGTSEQLAALSDEVAALRASNERLVDQLNATTAALAMLTDQLHTDQQVRQAAPDGT